MSNINTLVLYLYGELTEKQKDNKDIKVSLALILSQLEISERTIETLRSSSPIDATLIGEQMRKRIVRYLRDVGSKNSRHHDLSDAIDAIEANDFPE